MTQCFHSIELPHFCDVFKTPFSNKKAFEEYLRHQNKEERSPSKNPILFITTSASFSNQSDIYSAKELYPPKSKEPSKSNDRVRKIEGSKGIFDSRTTKNPRLSIRKLRCSLTEHRRKNPIVCDTCGKKFKWRSHLIIHRRCHTKERPYACCKCKKSYTQYGALNRHLRDKHSRKRLQASSLSE